ncbi:unnamed protein product [Trichogramma brassicae]|uniref:MYND-type domain-containing protein n=1 Tax=Trichogramma brassicae TaxID=86971 RepID=A0A6H5IGA2_9HYME|nr:unnamed protein product [Trichogramma brassicae]
MGARDNKEDREVPPRCQGCHERTAQFVCAGCGNQWYCSRECQVKNVGYRPPVMPKPRFKSAEHRKLTRSCVSFELSHAQICQICQITLAYQFPYFIFLHGFEFIFHRSLPLCRLCRAHGFSVAGWISKHPRYT